MRTEIRLLKTLLDHPGQPTIRRLAELAGADYRIAHTAAARLARKGAVTLRRTGAANEVILSRMPTLELFQAEQERQEDILKNKDLKALLALLKQRLGTSFYVLLLFGSYAKHTQTARSDIDLLFIIPDREMETRIERALSEVPLPVHPVILTEAEFRKMVKTTEFSVVSEAITQNVVLHGIEPYCEMVR